MWAPGAHTGDPARVPDSWPLPGPVLAIAGIWEVNQQTEDSLCPSAFQVENIFKNHHNFSNMLQWLTNPHLSPNPKYLLPLLTCPPNSYSAVSSEPKWHYFNDSFPEHYRYTNAHHLSIFKYVCVSSLWHLLFNKDNKISQITRNYWHLLLLLTAVRLTESCFPFTP